MLRIRVLRELDVMPGTTQSLDIRLAGCYGIVVVWTAMENADRSVCDIRLGQICGHAVRVERNVGGKIDA